MPGLEEYRKLRSAQKSLNSRVLRFLPEGAKVINTAARELGYRVGKGAIVFPSEAAMDRLYDFLIYEPNRNGKSWVQRFFDSEHDIPLEEETVLRAAIASETSLFEVVAIERSASRIRLRDLLQERPDISITDISLSSTVNRKGLLFSRILAARETAFSSGTSIAFPSGDKAFLLKRCERLDKIRNASLRSRKRFALFVKLEKFSSIETVFG